MASDIVRDGVFAINKPRGSSSAQVIRDCQAAFNPSSFFKPAIDQAKSALRKENAKQYTRRKLVRKAAQVKIGHGGTLDPLATGVLILGVGSATKSLSQFLECTKEYETIVLFGASTDTYDRVGRILAKRSYDHITKEKVEKELENFRGKHAQIPPLYSALKMNGKPLYEYAREGKAIPRELDARMVEVKNIELVEWYPPGTHNHRWPKEQAEPAECNLAEQVWRAAKQQESSKKLTPEEKEQDDQATAEHESFKRDFEERQDELIRDAPSKHQRKGKPALMSGALGVLPQPFLSDRGTNLVPEVDENSPPPWDDKGPPAVRIKMTVTSGFYVRSFCHDLGTKLGSAALMAELCRTRQSDFTVGGTNCLDFESLAKGEAVWGPQVADMLARWNGEPEGQWTYTEPAEAAEGASSDKQGDKSHNGGAKAEASGFKGKSEKRQRSRSPSAGGASPPRKVAKGSQSPQRPASSGSARRRSEDEQSWKGIVD